MSGVLPSQKPKTAAELASSLTPAAEYVDPIIELYKKDVDRSLLRENLKLTVQQRVERFEHFMDFVAEVRAAGQKARTEVMKRGA